MFVSPSLVYSFPSFPYQARSPRTSLWWKPRDLSLSIFVDLLSIFDSSGHALLFETLSSLDCPPPSMTFPSQPIMSSFCYEESFLQPTCALLVVSSLSAARWVRVLGLELARGVQIVALPIPHSLSDRGKATHTLLWVSLSVEVELLSGLLWDLMK